MGCTSALGQRSGLARIRRAGPSRLNHGACGLGCVKGGAQVLGLLIMQRLLLCVGRWGLRTASGSRGWECSLRLVAFAEVQMAGAASTAVNRRSHCQVRRRFPRSILLSKPPDLPTSQASAHSVTQRRRRLSSCGPVSGVRAPRGVPRWSEEHGGRNSPT